MIFFRLLPLVVKTNDNKDGVELSPLGTRLLKGDGQVSLVKWLITWAIHWPRLRTNRTNQQLEKFNGQPIGWF